MFKKIVSIIITVVFIFSSIPGYGQPGSVPVMPQGAGLYTPPVSEAAQAGDRAWDAAKQAGASDAEARAAAEAEYKKAAGNGAKTSSNDAKEDKAQQESGGRPREEVRAEVAQENNSSETTQPQTAAEAGDQAWDEAKKAGLFDDQARQAAENAYNAAAEDGAHVPWAQD